ncbi:Acylphosphatase-2 [Echinococcus granulosus]|uniref:acylphosphatase n=1 Tax=Echinococcus granulosus TaxID=6210 RepID=W6V9H7_ECHGR|nr:Acylphosphatase-2 [Echinococcus granulosus]EUB63279.1 Acylphosphatase-2 [Echinococcus granulosus]
MAAAPGDTGQLKRIGFEVFGRVQATAKQNSIVGWVRNTPSGTVEGEAEGSVSHINTFKEWLQHTGSPKSRIEKCEFSYEKTIDNLTFDSFRIIK